MDEAAYQQYRLESENWLKAARRDLLASMVGKATGGRTDLEILDLGAGVGQNVPSLLRFGAVDVLEINEIGLQVLRTIDGIRDIFDQPVPFSLDRRYDVIVATDVLEHLEDDRGAARWIAEHLKPGGIFFRPSLPISSCSASMTWRCIISDATRRATTPRLWSRN